MTGLRVDVAVTGNERSIELLDRLHSNLENGSGQLLSLVDSVIEAQQARFGGKGVRWRKLAAVTLRKHREEGAGTQPLVLTGALRDSLTERGNPNMRVELRPGTLRFGSRVFYAEFHQKGKGVPRRTVVGLSKDQRSDVVNQLRSFLMEGV